MCHQNTLLRGKLSYVLSFHRAMEMKQLLFWQSFVILLLVASLYDRLLSGGFEDFRNARSTLPGLYNILTLLMALNVQLFILTKLNEVMSILEAFTSLDCLLFKKANTEVTIKMSPAQSVLALFVLLLAIFDCFSSMKNSTLLYSMIGGIGHSLSLLEGCLLEQQFSSLVLATRLRFKIVNNKLTQLKGQICELNKGAINISEQFYFAKKLKNLRVINLKLCQQFQLIGETYEYILLAQVMYTFLALVCLLYFVVSSALSPKPGGGTLQVLALAMAILWLTVLALRLELTTWSIDNTIKQATLTGTLLQKINNRDLHHLVTNELNKFSNQIQHNMALSICGLLNLDLTILHSIAGTVTTYLVILIQFQSPSE